MSLLLKLYWPYLAGAAMLAGLIAWVMCYGHTRYAAGVADTRADYTRIAQEQIDFNHAHDLVEIGRLTKAVSDYEAKISVPDPLTVDLAHRVYRYALGACAVQQAPADTASPSSTAAEPAGAGEIERAAQAVFDAASHDAAQVIALQQAWPQ